MKKVLGLVGSMLIVTFLLTACGTEGSANREVSSDALIGMWHAASAEVVYDVTGLDTIEAVSLIFNEDGTGIEAWVDMWESEFELYFLWELESETLKTLAVDEKGQPISEAVWFNSTFEIDDDQLMITGVMFGGDWIRD